MVPLGLTPRRTAGEGRRDSETELGRIACGSSWLLCGRAMRPWWRSSLSAVSSRRSPFAPLALVVGGFAMLFTGLKLVFTNGRLTLAQALPAMWIWLAMYDLKAHVLHGKSFHVLRGPVLIPIVLVIAAITAASFFRRGVRVRDRATGGTQGPARGRAGPPPSHGDPGLGRRGRVAARPINDGRHPLGASVVRDLVSIVLGVMMVCYVAVPSRLIGVKPNTSRRDKLTATAVGGALGPWSARRPTCSAASGS